MAKTRVTFELKRIAEGDWQIEAHYPGAETRIIKGLTTKPTSTTGCRARAASTGCAPRATPSSYAAPSPSPNGRGSPAAGGGP